MKLQIYIRGEKMHEKEFPNIKVDHFAEERHFKKREKQIQQYVREIKKELFGNAEREIYCQVFMIQDSRAYHGPIKIDAPRSMAAAIDL